MMRGTESKEDRQKKDVEGAKVGTWASIDIHCWQGTYTRKPTRFLFTNHRATTQEWLKMLIVLCFRTPPMKCT
jgi:hypothetical protein